MNINSAGVVDLKNEVRETAVERKTKGLTAMVNV
jgi:hypothetical protein